MRTQETTLISFPLGHMTDLWSWALRGSSACWQVWLAVTRNSARAVTKVPIPQVAQASYSLAERFQERNPTASVPGNRERRPCDQPQTSHGVTLSCSIQGWVTQNTFQLWVQRHKPRKCGCTEPQPNSTTPNSVIGSDTTNEWNLSHQRKSDPTSENQPK